MKKNLMIVLLVVAAVVAVFVWNNKGEKPLAESKSGTVSGAPEGDAAPKSGYPAPSFSLAALEGDQTFSVGGPRDKLLIVNFWAAWCGPCEEEAPDLKDIFEKHKDKVDLYAVNATNYDVLREAKLFAKEQGFDFPVLTDEKGVAGDLYKVFAYPSSFIIDKNGVVIQRIDGIISREQWEIYLQDALKA